MNKTFLIGNLGQDPEIRATTGGTPVANLSIATNEFRGAGDDRKKFTEWHRVVVFGKFVAIIDQLYKKGKQVLIEGRSQTRKWTDKNGVIRWTTEVVAHNCQLLGPAPATAGVAPPIAAYDGADADEPAMPDIGDRDAADIPF